MTTPDEHKRARLAARAETYRAKTARLRELAQQATADHCSHGVDPRYCTDHKAAQPTDRPTTTAREGLRGAHR